MEEKKEVKSQKPDDTKQKAPDAPVPAETTVKAQPAPAADGAKQEEPSKKNKKINQMSLKEIDAKIKDAQEKMGSLKSRYARQLLKQKELLKNSTE
ncbi:MAG: hypothetical protein PHV77_03350 [Candidatus Omnitrophica bacterium]|jgi:hypothetical protein|nr:hypothetical protein [Candidatus Omnitrophota bacterium]